MLYDEIHAAGYKNFDASVIGVTFFQMPWYMTQQNFAISHCLLYTVNVFNFYYSREKMRKKFEHNDVYTVCTTRAYRA